ncbi:citrate synthase [uncultured Gemmiger sp.]|uniref:citrate synthase n=1 Tax=uncultured Gemmiger sp. TaxID=1623490 RepID=UPI0025D95C52|nr:citrate synthase [uncultured Gemmiger sp.]
MVYPDVAAFAPDEMELLCQEYLRNNYIDPSDCERLGVKRGLRNADGTGVLAGLTNVSDVVGYEKQPDGSIVPIPGRLIYRGIDIDQLVQEADVHDRFLFEEAVWLLLFGSLPDRAVLDRFDKLLEKHRELPHGFADDMILNSPSPNIMNKMARSVLAMYSYDEHAEDLSLPNMLRQSINLIAELPTMMVNAYMIKRRVYDRCSMYFHLPTPGQSTAEHILSTYRPDQKFTHEEARLLDLCLLVHADHGGGNCSTFTCRVLSSSGTDTYAAISAAIGALKGPKHGGANLKVMHQLDNILQNVSNPADDEELREYLRKIMRREAGDGSGLIYGIGHAVYTLSDPRAQILKHHARHLAYEKGFDREYETLCSIERLAPQVFAEEHRGPKKVCANVDLFSGLIYRMLGISEDLYTPLFAIARVPGWCAHRVEEVLFANRIIRPAYKYLGRTQEYQTLEERTAK